VRLYPLCTKDGLQFMQNYQQLQNLRMHLQQILKHSLQIKIELRGKNDLLDSLYLFIQQLSSFIQELESQDQRAQASANHQYLQQAYTISEHSTTTLLRFPIPSWFIPSYKLSLDISISAEALLGIHSESVSRNLFF